MPSPWIGPFQRHSTEPILAPEPHSWFERSAVYNPTVLLVGDTFYMLYRAEDSHDDYISRLGLATSHDGIHFTRYAANPVMGIDGPRFRSESRGCEDPRAVKIGDTYYLTYTAWNGYNVDLALATSSDLITWTKHGVIVPNTKAGAIYPEPINGRYIMYFGDTNIWIATSEDLLHWEVREEPVMRPRPDRFDSVLIEPGPSPVMTPDGLLLIYNSSNGTHYQVGQALFDKDDPTRLIARTDEPFLRPELAWEKWGKVNQVVFAEGLVRKGDTWYLYYGGADKCIGLATAPAI